MIKINKTECKSPRCTVVARYGVQGSHTKQSCFRLAKVGMVWIGEQRVLVPYPKVRRFPNVILPHASVSPEGCGREERQVPLDRRKTAQAALHLPFVIRVLMKYRVLETSFKVIV